MHDLDRLFNPESVAVVGSKQVDDHNWLRTVLPFQGSKYHVNLDQSEWASAEELGFPNYASLLDVPGPVDYVIVSVPAKVVPYVIKDCIAKGVLGVHLYTAGFSETGTEEGIRLENEIVALARGADLKIVGPNCVGIFNPQAGIGVNVGGYHGEPGNLAFISQSGSQAGGFAKGALANGMKLSKLVSMGNGIILDSTDYLDYFLQDDQTQVIGMYLEGIRDGRRFFNTLRQVCEKKPVIVWKVGETEDSARAVASHSTSRTCSAALWDAMLRQCGAIKVENVDELLETAKLLTSLPPVTGNRLALMALTGGHATEMSNVFTKAGFRVPALADESYRRILEKFDLVGTAYRNPIEGRTLTDPDILNNVLDVLNDDPNVDIIVHEAQVVVRDDKASLYRGHGPDLLCDFKARAKKPYLVALSTAHPHASQDLTDEYYGRLTKAGVPTLFGLQGAAAALRKLVDYYQYQVA